MPDPTGRNELLCPHCSLYMLMPKSATEFDVKDQAGANEDNTEGCPYCGTQMLVRWAEEAA